MGYIPPPLPLTKEEFEKNNGHDFAFEKWLRYARAKGLILWLWDKIRSKI